ncbi:oligogalacturonate lyase family protein [Halosimplex sp. TS25]|uniref:oligogalacturonate lyase family protein n=1 Tax=Halosimplex rarum TaxID=3396619 RepID=UPI0039E75FA1
MQLAGRFSETTAPETGRRVVQVTDGPGFCYPLYYYVPSLTPDGTLVYHRAFDGEVQLYGVDLPTGESTQLTDASATDTHWRPWCTDPGTGVLDHRSALNVERGEVIYFDGNDVRQVDVQTGTDTSLFELPEDRVAIGQNCVTPHGEWFVYIHHDRELFERVLDDGRHHSEDTVLAAYHIDSSEHRTLVRINSPIHHVLPYDDQHFVFCHPATENGMLLTDREGGWYSHLRTRDRRGGEVCHYLATARGLAYEVLGGSDGIRGGLYDPFTHDRVEFDLPDAFGYTHTGYDPDGKLFFYETAGETGHELWYLERYREHGEHEWGRLIGDWSTYGSGQKSHFHPRMTPDRNWIVFVAGDDSTGCNQIYLLDVSDLSHTRGFPRLQ